MTIAACGGGTGRTPAPPRFPAPTIEEPPAVADTATGPMIPDPVAVLPDSGLTVEPGTTPATPHRLLEEALALRDRGGRAGATAAAERLLAAVEADPRSVTARWELGWTYHGLGRWGDAVAAWDGLKSIDPRYPGLARHLPIARLRRDRQRARAAAGSPSLPLPVEETPRAGEPVRIAAVGDIQLGMGWPPEAVQLPPDGALEMFSRVRGVLTAADIAFGNLETVLADSGDSTKCRRGSRNCYAFRAPTRFAAALRRSGFDVLSVNNNHAGDFGPEGRRATMTALDGMAILHSGPSSGLASWETRGLRIALIAFGTGDGPYRIQDLDSATQAVLEADRHHDLVIVSFHGGAEGAQASRVPRSVERAFGENRGDVYRFAHIVVDAGADLVLGHGPHVLRGMELYRGRLIAYSLGNFAAWHGFNLSGPLGLSAVLEVTLAPNGVAIAATLTPVALQQPGIPAPDAEARAVAIVRRLSTDDFGAPVFDPDGRYVQR